MRARAAPAAAAAAVWLLSAGCGGFGGTRRHPDPPEPGLRIWTSPVIRWTAGEGRAVRFALENGTARTLRIEEPDAARARVAIFPGGETGRACGIEPPAAAARVEGDPAPSADTVALAPGDQVELRVDLAAACGELAPGEYRYEVNYVTAGAGAGGLTPRTSYGTLVVEGAGHAVGRAGPSAPRRRPP